MDVSRLRTGEWLTGLGGIALLAVTFLPWYARSGAGATAWEAFSVVDVLLALVALAGLAVPFFAASRRAPAVPVAAAVIAAGLAIITTLVVLYRLLDQPGPNDAVALRLGAYLGLLAVLAVAAGAWRTMDDERLDAEPPPAIPAQPAPDAVAAAGSVVATGGVPEAAPQRPPGPN